MHPTGSGTVFKVNKDGSHYTVLHRFPAMPGDGIAPWAGLVEGRDGALYGTTSEGGRRDGGILFKLKKDGSGYAKVGSRLPSGFNLARPPGRGVSFTLLKKPPMRILPSS